MRRMWISKTYALTTSRGDVEAPNPKSRFVSCAISICPLDYFKSQFLDAL